MTEAWTGSQPLKISLSGEFLVTDPEDQSLRVSWLWFNSIVMLSRLNSSDMVYLWTRLCLWKVRSVAYLCSLCSLLRQCCFLKRLANSRSWPFCLHVWRMFNCVRSFLPRGQKYWLRSTHWLHTSGFLQGSSSLKHIMFRQHREKYKECLKEKQREGIFVTSKVFQTL